MRREPKFGWVALGILSVALAGCGEDDEEPECTPLHITGAPFAASGEGAGKAHGSGQLPANTKNGMELELLVTNVDGFGSSVWPDNLFATTCGPTFTFEIRELDPDTYRLGVAVLDPGSDASEPLYEATSTNSFTIVGAEDVAFNPTF